VRVAIWTGYSSLMYLRQLPISFVKTDQSFVTDIASDDPALTIVGAIIQLAHTLGLRVGAEGVETAAQLALLREFGCDRAQGGSLLKIDEIREDGRVHQDRPRRTALNQLNDRAGPRAGRPICSVRDFAASPNPPEARNRIGG